jgi:hypothetical protein
VSSGVSVPLEGAATDINSSTGTLPCSALRWTSSRTGDTFTSSGIGCTPSVTFSGTGTRTISLVATDPLGAASVPATVAITVNACSGTCGPTAFITLPEPDWEYLGFPVFFRESTVPIRLSIGHALAPARNPVAYRLSIRRIGTTTTTTIRSGSVSVTSPTAPVNVNFNWVVGSTIPYWSLCDTPSSYRNHELLLEVTDSGGTRSTHPIEVKLGCALI